MNSNVLSHFALTLPSLSPNFHPCPLTSHHFSLLFSPISPLSGQVDSTLILQGSLQEPELTGHLKLSRGIVYLSQEKNPSHPGGNGGNALENRGEEVGANLGGVGGVTGLLPYFSLPGKSEKFPKTLSNFGGTF